MIDHAAKRLLSLTTSCTGLNGESGIDQLKHAIGIGVRFGWVTFGEDYGQIPEFWLELDGLGLRGMGVVRKRFFCWPTRPKYRLGHPAHGSKHADIAQILQRRNGNASRSRPRLGDL